jgi:hypothetical protein
VGFGERASQLQRCQLALDDFVSTPVASAALIFLYIGYSFGASAASKRAKKLLGWNTEESERIRLQTETRYLDILRRELANLIVSDDPRKMVTAYYKAWEFERTMSTAPPSRVDAELNVLTEQYPLYGDFDLVNLRHFVPYSDAADTWGEDAIKERYLDISKFMALKNIKAKSTVPIFSEDESKTLQNSMRRESDRRFRTKIEDAMKIYNVARSADKEQRFEQVDYEDASISVFPLQHFAESRWGIHFKTTDECGIYSVFYADNSKAYRSYYRSDNSFQEETPLHP